MLSTLIALLTSAAVSVSTPSTPACALGAQFLQQESDGDARTGAETAYFVGEGAVVRHEGLFGACPRLLDRLPPHIRVVSSYKVRGEPGAPPDAPVKISSLGKPEFSDSNTKGRLEVGWGCEYAARPAGSPPPLCGGSSELFFILEGERWVQTGTAVRSVS